MEKTRVQSLRVKLLDDDDMNSQDFGPKVKPSIEERANCLSRLLFWYTNKLMALGAKKVLMETDLWEMRKEHKFKSNIEKFRRHYQDSMRGGKKPSLWYAIRKTTGCLMFTTVFLLLLSNLLQFAGPFVVQQLVKFAKDPTIPDTTGYMWAGIIFLTNITRVLLQQQGLHRVNHNSYHILFGIEGLLYEKITKVSCATRKYYDAGRTMNLVNVDINSLLMFSQMGFSLFSAPFIITIAMGWIIFEVGWIGLLGPVLMFINVQIQNKIQTKIMTNRKSILMMNDRRAKAINEYVAGIRIIKYYGWEKLVENTIEGIRQIEAKMLKTNQLYRFTSEFFTTITPISISIGVFSLYIYLQGENLSPEKAFATLTLFNLLQMPLRLLIFSLVYFSTARVSLKRIEHFLSADVQEDYVNRSPEAAQFGEVRINQGQFAWDSVVARLHDIEAKKLMTGPPGAKPPGAGDKGKKPSGNRPQPPALEKKQSEPDISSADNPVLKNINLDIEAGKLVAVVGQVGSGKSSLLHAILGEMIKQNGEVIANGNFAFISQQSWLRNATVRDNIVFGNPFDEAKYKKVIKKCQLESDLAILQGGDQTEIGERGINLSGGQKQRIAIARAVYSDADIYVIDDCLSALDAHVGKKIFKGVIKGMLKGKTRILVTHALYFMHLVDKIVVMKDGTVLEYGTYNELISNQDSEFRKLSLQTKTKDSPVKKKPEDKLIEEEKEEEKREDESSDEEEDDDDDEKQADQSPNRQEQTGEGAAIVQKTTNDTEEKQKYDKGKLTGMEIRSTGGVPGQIYRDYLNSGGICITIMVILVFLIAQGMVQFNDWWLGSWSVNRFNLPTYWYIIIYGCLSLFAGMMSFAKGVVFRSFTITAALNLHRKLIHALMKTPISWYDVTPSGRIVNRCTKDQDDVDSNLPFTIQIAFASILQVIFVIIMISAITPLFLIMAFFLFTYYISVIGYYLKTAREIKRVCSILKAPLLTHIGETYNGLYILRSAGKLELIYKEYQTKADSEHRSRVNQDYTNRWISLRTDFFGAVVVGGAAFFGVLSRQFDYSRDQANIGLSLTWALSIIGSLSFTIRNVADTEVQMNSVQRILEFIESNPRERSFVNPAPPQDWPTEGTVEAKDLYIRYRPDLPTVIKGITFSINNGEKIGVVGRTGSGKSTLTLALLRIIELSEESERAGGHIKISGLDISHIGLNHLRTRVTIIPQDPVLFTGNVRMNIDPFNDYGDEAIVEALKKVQMWDQLKRPKKKAKPGQPDQPEQPVDVKVQIVDNVETDDRPKGFSKSEVEAKLNLPVDDGGSNYSVGQRQLLCMARALVRRSKILLMDEATASIDQLTDSLIQKMIKTEFKNATVITIAHRLNTIIQYDRILVLSSGNIVEYDSPLNLMDKQDGTFASLINENGPEFVQKMRYLATHRETDAV
eukprot:TRINITY_DN4883_c0_g1_i2.p1 TRINITY_DN4883_c0_g1~~TRINITY_DN4883_c0_g1_i2.p1  ORF type:complete len:1425 (+),score=392.81 TRINITY_DN4883_c0_g1_i2:120-4394(+)